MKRENNPYEGNKRILEDEAGYEDYRTLKRKKSARLLFIRLCILLAAVYRAGQDPFDKLKRKPQVRIILHDDLPLPLSR